MGSNDINEIQEIVDDINNDLEELCKKIWKYAKSFDINLDYTDYGTYSCPYAKIYNIELNIIDKPAEKIRIGLHI